MRHYTFSFPLKPCLAITRSVATDKVITKVDNKTFETERGACVTFTWTGELWLFIHLVHAELPAVALLKASMFWDVNLNWDVLTKLKGVESGCNVPQRTSWFVTSALSTKNGRKDTRKLIRSYLDTVRRYISQSETHIRRHQAIACHRMSSHVIHIL